MTIVNTEWDSSGPEGPIVTGICAMPFVPIIDGKFLPENPLRLIQSGNFKKTEVLLGANSEEGSYFLIYFLTHLFKLQQNVTITIIIFSCKSRTNGNKVNTFSGSNGPLLSNCFC